MSDAARSLFDSDDEGSPEPETSPFTTWYNPTDRDVRLDLHVETPKPHQGSGPPTAFSEGRRTPTDTKREGVFNERRGTKLFIVKARAEKVIPSEFDGAIQKVKDGVVMSGLAPQLLNKGLKELPKVHASLDVALQNERAATARAKDLMLEKQALIDAQASQAAELEALREIVRKQNEEKAELQAAAKKK